MNATPPTWLQRLLGIDTAPGEGTIWNLEHSWNWPAWVTLLFAILAVAFVVSTYLRESGRSPRGVRLALAAIRLALVALVLAMLAQFSLAIHRTGLPTLAVIADDSLSMTIADRYNRRMLDALRPLLPASDAEKATRWEILQGLLCQRDGALLRSLAQRYRLRLYFLTGPRPSQATTVEEMLAEIRRAEPAGTQTRLGAGVRRVLDDLRGTVPAAVVLLSDGVNTAGPPLADAALYAQRRGVPLFAVAIGRDQPIQDLKLSDLLVEEVVFVNDLVSFDAKLTATGLPPRKVRVTLRRAEDGQLLAESTVVTAPDGQPRQLRLTWRPGQPGRVQLVMEAETLPEEVETENNRQSCTVEVSDKQIQVLLVQGYPSFEFRYLWNLLTRDSTINVHAVLQQADAEMVVGEVAGDEKQALWPFPVRREDLFQYDVIILGDVDLGLLSPAMLQDLADFVDKPGKGGAMIFIAGPRYMPSACRGTPLEPLLPIDLSDVRLPAPGQPLTDGFTVQPTGLGEISPSMQLGNSPSESRTIWKNLPPLYWMVEAGKLKPGARVLAVAPERLDPQGRPLPVIVMQYVGAGKVLFHATDETYRWRLGVGDVFFARYWVQTIRYLSRTKLAEGSRTATLTTDRREYTLGESVRLRLRFADERDAPDADRGVTVVVEHAGHRTRRVELTRSPLGRGIFEGLLTRPAVGSYHAWVAVPAIEGGTPSADFTVVAPPGEFERTEMDVAALRRATETTKGRFYTPDKAARLLGDLPEGRQVPVESLPPRPLWNRWPVLALFLLLLAGEWILRKLAGMV